MDCKICGEHAEVYVCNKCFVYKERERILQQLKELRNNLQHESWKNILPESEVISIIKYPNYKAG